MSKAKLPDEALLHKGPLRIWQIQEKVGLASGSMTAAVDRLERLGLVVREASPDDRRGRVVELTPQGRRLAAACFAKMPRIWKRSCRHSRKRRCGNSTDRSKS
jgi:DNA-binding MarR family transcriptional regulator